MSYPYSVAKIGRGLFLISCCLALCSCWDDQQKAVAGCDTEAEHVYPKSPEDQNRYVRGGYIHQCMIAQGYEWHWASDRCEPMIDASEDQNPYCYVPTSWLGRLIFKWEMQQQGVGVRGL
jgi:hypothetical protein